MLIDFLLVFPLLLRLGGSYVGSISVLFSYRFLYRFFVDLEVYLGVILAGFGGSKPVIVGIDFGMIWACRSKSGPRAPKRGPRVAKSGQERPRAAQEHPRAAQDW